MLPLRNCFCHHPHPPRTLSSTQQCWDWHLEKCSWQAPEKQRCYSGHIGTRSPVPLPGLHNTSSIHTSPNSPHLACSLVPIALQGPSLVSLPHHPPLSTSGHVPTSCFYYTAPGVTQVTSNVITSPGHCSPLLPILILRSSQTGADVLARGFLSFQPNSHPATHSVAPASPRGRLSGVWGCW